MILVCKVNRDNWQVSEQYWRRSVIYLLVYSMDDEMLSRMAEEAIGEMKNNFSLNPEQFKRFFLTEAHGKPRPNILPIARSFTEDINGLIRQLRYFLSSLNDAHGKYMAERKKSKKLEEIIKTLVENIRKEVRSEKNEGRIQMSLYQYIGTEKYTARNNLRLSSKAEEVIKEMTEETLNSVEFERFLLQVALGRPPSKLLPILRSFTADVRGVINQLMHLKKILHEDHDKYMVEHEKNKNLCNRIKRLIDNLQKEEQQEICKRVMQLRI